MGTLAAETEPLWSLQGNFDIEVWSQHSGQGYDGDVSGNLRKTVKNGLVFPFVKCARHWGMDTRCLQVVEWRPCCLVPRATFN
jgi:hypothetical protein